jgi:uncharacterized protein
MANHLLGQRSPYLLQHLENPVDWHPWGLHAFAKAAELDRPIFLSIGYSTCHWCHVMAHESFEDEEVAGVLNREFVSIKVDREERPDIDRVYMTFVQATTGSGGWPLSVWLTPDLEPFFGGTYFSREPREGYPGFPDVLAEIARVWKADRARLEDSARAILDRLRDLGRREAGRAIPGPEALAEAEVLLAAGFDREAGGFAGAPKFPRPSELFFLFREWARTGDDRPRAMAIGTLRAMAFGGIRDHLGGGFHRYTVDRQWRLPHFEKMLYDQAQLALAFLEAGQATGDPFYVNVAEETLAYVQRDLTSPDGAFYSAEGADSLPPERAGEPGGRPAEGRFYLWRDEEIAALLGDEADGFRTRFGIRPEGNLPGIHQREFPGLNGLFLNPRADLAAGAPGRQADESAATLERARRVLFEARSRRPRPNLDDKVITAWNGLMIAAFARAGRVLAAGTGSGITAGSCVRAAQRAAAFLRREMWDADAGALSRRYREGERTGEGYADDYANLIFGLIELFQADGDPSWLEWALALQRRQDALFWDEQNGGWFSTSGRDPSVLLRQKEDHDGAEPSATSVALFNLLALAHLTGTPAWFHRLERTLQQFGTVMEESPRALPMMLAALSAYRAGVRQIAIVGPGHREDTRELQRVIAGAYRPFCVVVPMEPGPQGDRTRELLGFPAPLPMIDGRATAYVCRDFRCERPTADAAELRRQLR